jgi:hypothetical protein
MGLAPLTADDHVAIQQLYLRYAVAVDMHEIEEYVSCYTEDAEYVGYREGGLPYAKGHDALRGMVRNNAEKQENGYHVCTGPLLEPAEFGARGRCYLLYVVAEVGEVEEFRNALYYRDELVKQDGQWRFRRRVTTALPAGRGGAAA